MSEVSSTRLYLGNLAKSGTPVTLPWMLSATLAARVFPLAVDFGASLPLQLTGC